MQETRCTLCSITPLYISITPLYRCHLAVSPSPSSPIAAAVGASRHLASVHVQAALHAALPGHGLQPYMYKLSMYA
jgi:hypothetical protein